MNTNLYTKELKRNRKNLVTWSLIVIGFTALILAIFPSMAEMGEDITKMMDKLPEELGKAMGMDAQTWSSIIGFYSTYYGIYIILLMGIFTMSTGTTIVSKEEKEGTSEFLLTRPVSRKEVFFTKMMSLFTLLLIIFFIQTIAAVILFNVFGEDVDWRALTIMHVHGFVIILFFTCLGVLLSMFFRPKRNFMGMVVGLIFGSYFLSALSKAADSISWLGYISPFHYLDFAPLDPEYDFNALAAVIILVLGAAILYIAFRVFQRKDIAG